MTAHRGRPAPPLAPPPPPPPIQMPSPDVNPTNAIDRFRECHGLMLASQWEQFMFLYPKITSYYESRNQVADHSRSDNDPLTAAWNNLRLHAVEAILNRLAGSRKFDDFVSWLQRLADIINDQRTLWDLLHTEVQPSLKVTLDESDRISAMFFPPSMRFEFGLDSFLQCSLCNLTEARTMSLVIDIFYCLLGYIDSCHLEPDYVTTTPHFLDFIDRLLLAFLKARGFDPHRFVWLIEKIREFAHLPFDVFQAVCERALEAYVNGKTILKGLNRLQGIIILSTSPSLQELPLMRNSVGKVFHQIIKEQHDFTQRYIFGSYGTLSWLVADCEQSTDQSSYQLRAWHICLANFVARVRARPELPVNVIVAFLDDSLAFLRPYYGEVQASLVCAVRLRMDAIEIISAFGEYYPGVIPLSTKQALWFLLFVVAISGAADEDLQNVLPMQCSEDQELFLGIEHTDRELLNYRVALCRLRPKFEAEFDEVFLSMASFLRQNYTEQ
jgi:hypothetical protein